MPIRSSSTSPYSPPNSIVIPKECLSTVKSGLVKRASAATVPLVRINRKGRPFATCSICNCTPCESPEEHAKLKLSTATTLPATTTATAAGYLSPPPIASLPPSFCSMAATNDSMSMSMVNPLFVDANRMYNDLAVSFADSNAIYAIDEMGLDDVSATMLAADPVFQGNDWDWLHDDHPDGGVL
ncbi:hypothetical protein AbraIFM66951_000953 [Aspergillus brasiliensis]|uniref:Uncharacterized protein n=1 Tax=Aspergillus brasiliensis TaxID=319629 RepID=A0A9W6DK57_9EURO|nr:hypothetical protein AbraCBS73388_000964 [Aspergillus brasiliensis]GKZ42245.1 hypothetical protein AbraIFM66951_000953 [Aspergillus brasiliensis]